MRTIRTTRLRKYKKINYAIKVTWNLGFAWCLIIIAFIDLPLKSTNAIFMDQITYDSNIKAGIWWDGSKLSFTNSYGWDCNEIYANVKNIGKGDMGSDSKFYVYYFSGKAPYLLKNGSRVFDKGIIKRMTSNAAPQKLAYMPTIEGAYLFVAFQHSEMPDELSNGTKIEGRNVIVSNPIIIKKNCKDKDDVDDKIESQNISGRQNNQLNQNQENESSKENEKTYEPKSDSDINSIKQPDTDHSEGNTLLNIIEKNVQKFQENLQTKP